MVTKDTNPLWFSTKYVGLCWCIFTVLQFFVVVLVGPLTMFGAIYAPEHSLRWLYIILSILHTPYVSIFLSTLSPFWHQYIFRIVVSNRVLEALILYTLSVSLQTLCSETDTWSDIARNIDEYSYSILDPQYITCIVSTLQNTYRKSIGLQICTYCTWLIDLFGD